MTYNQKFLLAFVTQNTSVKTPETAPSNPRLRSNPWVKNQFVSLQHFTITCRF